MLTSHFKTHISGSRSIYPPLSPPPLNLFFMNVANFCPKWCKREARLQASIRSAERRSQNRETSCRALMGLTCWLNCMKRLLSWIQVWKWNPGNVLLQCVSESVSAVWVSTHHITLGQFSLRVPAIHHITIWQEYREYIISTSHSSSFSSTICLPYPVSVVTA